MSASVAPKIHRPRIEAPGIDPRADTLLGMIMALTSEVTVLRQRLDAHERLAVAGTAPTPTTVDAYEPDDAAEATRATQRQRILDKVCRPLAAANSEG